LPALKGCVGMRCTSLSTDVGPVERSKLSLARGSYSRANGTKKSASRGEQRMVLDGAINSHRFFTRSPGSSFLCRRVSGDKLGRYRRIVSQKPLPPTPATRTMCWNRPGIVAALGVRRDSSAPHLVAPRFFRERRRIQWRGCPVAGNQAARVADGRSAESHVGCRRYDRQLRSSEATAPAL